MITGTNSGRGDRYHDPANQISAQMIIGDVSCALMFRQQIALAAGLQRTDAGRVAIFVADSGNRRLLPGLIVNVTINMPNASSAQTAAAGLTASAINNLLTSVVFPKVFSADLQDGFCFSSDS